MDKEQVKERITKLQYQDAQTADSITNLLFNTDLTCFECHGLLFFSSNANIVVNLGLKSKVASLLIDNINWTIHKVY